MTDMIPSETEQAALDLFIESVYKPDFELRAASREQECFDELMALRQEVLDYLHNKKASMQEHLVRTQEPAGDPSF